MASAPFPIIPELQAIAVAYKNTKLIADQVLPRVPVGRSEFEYLLYPKEQAFTVPETKVGRRSKPNIVETSATNATSSVEDYALDDPIPQKDIENGQSMGLNVEGRSTEQTMNLILLDREIRASNLVFNTANYAAANQQTLSGTSQWSDFANSDPIKDVMDGLDSCIMRPNIMVIGRLAFSQLAQHPSIIKAINKTAGDTGIAQRNAIAALFELDDVLVGEAWVNNARKGQTANLVRAWGKNCALIYQDKMADTRGGITFGYTAQWGPRIAGSWPDKDIGMRGGVNVRVGESVKELITANDLGYYFNSVVA